MSRSPEILEAQYSCEFCKQGHKILLKRESHSQLINFSNNGLVVYSVMHKCTNGYPLLYNLHVDFNGAVRSFSKQDFPPMRQQKKTPFGLPSATIPHTYVGNDLKKINLFFSDGSLSKINMKLHSEMLGIAISIGSSFEGEPFVIQESDLGFTRIMFYRCDYPATGRVQSWLNFVANLLDSLPPKELGNLVEMLLYMVDNFNETPSDFDEQLLKRLLASHEIYVCINKSLEPKILKEHADALKQVLKESEAYEIDEVLQILSEHPDGELSLRELVGASPNPDTLKTIYLLLLLEIREIIHYETPGIVA